MTLAEYITQNLTRPFQWGENDCALFASRWVMARTGKDYLADIDKWDSEGMAKAVLIAVGGFEVVMDRKFERINPHLACDGDIALHDGCLRIYSGNHVCSPGEFGLIFFPRMEAKCAWRCA